MGIHITGQITDGFADRFTGDSTLIIRFYFANSNLFRELISFVSSQVGAVSVGFGIYFFENSIPSYKALVSRYHLAVAKLFLPGFHVVIGKIRSVYIGFVC